MLEDQPIYWPHLTQQSHNFNAEMFIQMKYSYPLVLVAIMSITSCSSTALSRKDSDLGFSNTGGLKHSSEEVVDPDVPSRYVYMWIASDYRTTNVVNRSNRYLIVRD